MKIKIFLSYSSKTNNSVEVLLNDLSQFPDYELWIDKKLSGGQQWWDEILLRIRDCDIFILALSQESQDSVACSLEYTYARRLRKHILPVLVGDNVRMNQLPSELKTVQFINYCNSDKSETIALIKAINSFPPTEPLPFPLPDTPEVPLQSKERCVFLGDVTHDLEEERASVKSYLNQYGIYVFPNTCYSLDSTLEQSNLRSLTEKDLSECAVFVQLLNGRPGKNAEDSPNGYLQLQYDIARNSGKPLFQWRSPYLDISSIQDEEHRLLVSGEMVRAEGIEEFKRTVKDFILKPAQVKPRQVKKSANLNAFIFVNMESSDRSLAEKVCHELERQGVGYSRPLSSGDPSDIRSDLEANLLECNGLIVIYGSSTAVWVRRQLLECRKMLSKREKPIQAFALFEGPPEEKSSIECMFPNLQLLDLKKGLDDFHLDKEISAFIEGLEKENA
ncbi:MAG: toll/interleukin-1 receptor domain-containing protein [Parachlamydiaceae bacterium]